MPVKAKHVPKGAIEVYEVVEIGRNVSARGHAWKERKVLMVTDDKEEASQLATAHGQGAKVSRRLAVRLPEGPLYLLASVYPVRTLTLRRQHRRLSVEVVQKEHDYVW